MGTNLKNLMALLSLLDEVIIAEVFDKEDAYKNLKKKQYIPYLDKMLNESDFRYKSYSSFTIHYYNFTDQCQVCVIGRFSDAFNTSLKQLFSSLKQPNDVMVQSTILDWIFDAIPEVIAYKDTDGYFRFVTKDADDLYKRFDTIVNKHYTEIYSDQSIEEIEFLDDEAYKAKGKVKRVIDIETDFGYRTYESTRTPLYDSLDNPLGIISINRDITDINELKSQYDRITSIQETLIEIANSFIDMSKSQFNLVINEALKKIGQVISADRCYIFRYFFEENKMNNAFEWCNDGIKPEIDNLQNQPIDDFLEDWVQLHRNHENVVIDDVSKLDKNKPLYTILTSQNIKSLFTMPIFTDDECYGFIGFDSVKRHRSWKDIPNLIKILPNLVGNLFTRFYLYKMLYSANEQNKEINHNNQEFLSTLQTQINRPIKEIRSLVNEKSNNEELLYQVDLIDSTIENMTIISETDNIIPSAFTRIHLEELLIRIIKNNIKYASQNNVRLHLKYDYYINSTLTSNESKLRIVIDTIIKQLIDGNPDGVITINSRLLSDNDPYQKIKIGASISTKTISKKIKKTLLTLNKILKDCDSQLEFESHDESSEIHFIITYYTPSKLVKLSDMSKRIAFIDLTIDDSSNTLEQIHSLYTNVTLLSPQSEHHELNQRYGVIFIHTNNPDFYSSNIKTLLSNFDEDVIKVLLYENEYSIVYDNSFVYYNHTYQVPVLSSNLNINNIVSTPDLSDKIPDDRPSILVLDNNKQIHKMIKTHYNKSDVNIYQFMTSKDIDQLQIKNVKVILIDEYLPLETGANALKNIRKSSLYVDSHIYLMSSFIEDQRNHDFLNSKTHLVKKPLEKNTLKNIINHHLFDEKLSNTDHSHETKLFNEEQFKAYYPKIENQEIMISMMLTKLKKLYDELNENDDINLRTIQTKIEHLALQMHTDKLRTYISKYNLTIENKDIVLVLIKNTMDTIQKTISN